MKKVCKKCGIEKEISEFYKDNTLKFYVKNVCKSCDKKYREKNVDKKKAYDKKYQREKYNTDSQYRLNAVISSNIRQAFKLYTKNGKTKSCKEYNIDFQAIFEHVGPRPDGDYHLDHIIPQAAFDYDNLEHVRLAHLPQNLRWLDATKNLSKNNIIDWTLIDKCPDLQKIAKEIGLIK